MMKRNFLISILLMILCVVLLNQCTARDLTFRGEVIATQSNAGNPLFLIRTDKDKEYCILTDETTFLHSWLDGTEAEELVSGELLQPVVQVYTTTQPTRFRLEEKTYKAFLAEQIILLSIMEPDAYSLPDGTKLDIRLHDNRIFYQTKDGTAILTEQLPIGPDRVHVGGQLSLVELEPVAQQQILQWYENRGLLYNLDGQIQAAWAAYMACDNQTGFQDHYVAQEIYPSANNETLIWFNTTVTTPMDGQNVTEQRSSAAFRRDTGEHLPLAELFTCSLEDLGDLVLEAADVAGSNLADMKKAFKPEYLVFHSDALEICFPAGSLPDSTYTSIVSADYENLTGILQPWAIPVASE